MPPKITRKPRKRLRTAGKAKARRPIYTSPQTPSTQSAVDDYDDRWSRYGSCDDSYCGAPDCNATYYYDQLGNPVGYTSNCPFPSPYRMYGGLPWAGLPYAAPPLPPCYQPPPQIYPYAYSYPTGYGCGW